MEEIKDEEKVLSADRQEAPDDGGNVTEGVNASAADERLGDILADAGVSANTIFNSYKPRNEIAEEIGKVLLSRRYKSKNRQRSKPGFYNSEINSEQIGLITNSIGLQVVADLSAMGFNLGGSDRGRFHYEKVDETLGQIFEELKFEEAVFEQIKSIYDENSEMKYDLLTYKMTPFISDSDIMDDSEADDESLSLVTSCVESASQVLKACVGIRTALLAYDSKCDKNSRPQFNLFNKKVYADELATALEYLIHYTADWLNDACITADRNAAGNPVNATGEELIYTINGLPVGTPYVEYLGWNFFKVDRKTDDPEAGDGADVSEEKQPGKQDVPEKRMKEEYEPSTYMTYSVCSAYMALNAVIGEYYGKEKPPAGRYSERNAAFAQSMDITYRDMKNRCMMAGRYEEMRRRGVIGGGRGVDLAVKFLGQNYTAVDYSDILNSTTNDALINTVLHTLILIYAGIDMDYSLKDMQEEFYDEIQYALQNVLRVYKKLAQADKLYIVEQYVLSFKEKMPASVSDMAKQLRRQRIQVASTLPLLIRAYNEVSRYLVKYPQKQNTDYLALIMDNRTEIKRKGVALSKEWSWDKDGYNLMSEANFVRALSDFYDYYATYEEIYLKSDQINTDLSIARKNNDDLQRKCDELNSTVNGKDKEIAELNAKIKDLQKNVNPLVKQMWDFIDKRIEEKIGEYTKKAIDTVMQDCLASDDFIDSSLKWKATELFWTLIHNSNEMRNACLKQNDKPRDPKDVVQETLLNLRRAISPDGIRGQKHNK